MGQSGEAGNWRMTRVTARNIIIFIFVIVIIIIIIGIIIIITIIIIVIIYHYYNCDQFVDSGDRTEHHHNHPR